MSPLSKLIREVLIWGFPFVFGYIKGIYIFLRSRNVNCRIKLPVQRR